MATATTEAPAAAAEETKKGGMKKIIIIVVVLALVGGGVYWFFLKPKPVATSWPAPVAGTVLAVDPLTVNLAGSHFLKLGMAVQFSKAAGEEANGSKALDLAISQFSGKTIAELSTAEGREKNRQELVIKIVHAYDEVGEAEEATKLASAAATATSDAEAAAIVSGEDEGEAAAEGETKAEGKTKAGEEEHAEETKYAEVLSRTFAYDVYFTSFVMQ